MNDHSLSYATHLTALASLAVRACPEVHANHAEELGCLSRLQELSFLDCRISPCGLGRLATLTQLRKLTIVQADDDVSEEAQVCRDVGLAWLSCLTNLVALRCQGFCFNANGLKALQAPQLKHLAGEAINWREDMFLQPASSVESLLLEQVAPESLQSYLQHQQALKHFCTWDVPLRRTLGTLSSLSATLETLVLGYCCDGPLHEVLPRFVNLKSLCVQRVRGDLLLHACTQVAGLRCLHLSDYAGMSADGLEALLLCVDLRDVGFYGCRDLQPTLISLLVDEGLLRRLTLVACPCIKEAAFDDLLKRRSRLNLEISWAKGGAEEAFEQTCKSLNHGIWAGLRLKPRQRS